MGAPLRSRLKEDERRAQLLELGLRLFGTRSYEDVSIDDIAAAADVSKGLLYHYFGSKRDFYVEVVSHAAARLVEALRPDPELSPSQRVLAGIDAYLSFVEDRAEAYTALMTGGLGRDPEVGAILQRTREVIVSQIMTDLGLEPPRPVFALSLRSYIGAVEAGSLHWLVHRDVPRPVLLTMLAMGLRNAIELASTLDPTAPVDPAVVSAMASPKLN